MASILVLSPDSDIHAQAVIWGLEQKGHDVTRIVGSDFPVRQSLAITIADSYQGTIITEENQTVDIASFDVVWRRRGEFVEVKTTDIHPDDIKYALAEAEDAAMGWREISGLSKRPTWINSAYAGHRCRNKPFQLAQAKLAMLSIPETLISNDPDAVWSFYEKMNGQIIYKTLTPTMWEEDGETLAPFVEILSREMAEDREAIALTPGIYQKYTKKAYELRVNIFDKHIVATKINSQSQNSTEIDWRPNVKDASLELYELPATVKERLLDFMERVGLRFGALDLIKTRGGEYVFLEVNEMGQFLWIDDMLPEANLLQTFCAFLVTNDRPFLGNISGFEDLSYEDFCKRS